MKFDKPSPDVVALFAAVAPSPATTKGVQERKMFGYPCMFVNGNMFMGLFKDNLILRLAEQERADIARLGAKPFEPMPGRVMKEYVVVPESMMAEDSKDLRAWIAKSLAFASSLPPKTKKSHK